MSTLRRVQITELDPEYRRGLAEHLMGIGAMPVLFEVPEDFDVDAFEGVALVTGSEAVRGAAQPDFRAQFGEVVAWLEAYKGNFDFYCSLKAQLAAKGSLSSKQIDAVQRAIDRDKASGKTVPGAAPQVFSVVPGTTWVLSKFIANKVAQAAGFTRAFRTVEVVELEAETPKAFRAKVKLSARKTSHCGICGLGLENAVSVAAGIGPICAENWGIPYGEGSLAALHAQITTAAEATVWVPKSAIRETVTPEGVSSKTPKTEEPFNQREVLEREAQDLRDEEERVKAIRADLPGEDQEAISSAYDRAMRRDAEHEALETGGNVKEILRRKGYL